MNAGVLIRVARPADLGSVNAKRVAHLHGVGRKFDQYFDVVYLQLLLTPEVK